MSETLLYQVIEGLVMLSWDSLNNFIFLGFYIIWDLICVQLGSHDVLLANALLSLSYKGWSQILDGGCSILSEGIPFFSLWHCKQWYFLIDFLSTLLSEYNTPKFCAQYDNDSYAFRVGTMLTLRVMLRILIYKPYKTTR